MRGEQRPAIAGAFIFFNDTATTEIYTLSLTRRSSDLTGSSNPIQNTISTGSSASVSTAPTRRPRHTSHAANAADKVTRRKARSKAEKTPAENRSAQLPPYT